MIKRIFTLFLLCLCPSSLVASPLLNEFMALNSATIADEDGDFPDWIEIYNDSAAALDMDGLYLSDDPTQLTRWQFPAVSIPANGYLLVFASGKDRTDPASELHTNFSLKSGGEYLAIVDADGTTVLDEYPTYPNQTADVSYGRLTPAAGSLSTYFNVPTPGTVNDGANAPAELVQFSEPSQTFTGSLSVALSVQSPTATIRYTTNGTLPNASSPLYSAPIPVSASTRLRAFAQEPGRPDGPVSGEYYVHMIASLASVTSDLPLVIVESFGGGRPTSDRTAVWMIFEPDPKTGRSSLLGVPALATRSAVRVRGSSTAGAAKYSMNVEARNELDEDKDVAPLGLPAESDWILSGRYTFDRTLIHNPFIFEISNQIGRYAMRTRFCEIYNNEFGGSLNTGDYFGVYTLMEKIKRGPDRVDIARLDPTDNAEPDISGGYILKIDRADPGDSVTINAANQTLRWVDPKSNERTAQQQTWITNYMNGFGDALFGLDARDPVTGYAAWCDVDSFIDHQLLNVVPKNVDAFRLSAYMHKDRGGKLVAGPIWDYDRSMESTDGRDNNFNVWRGEGGDQGTDFFHYPWYNQMFSDTNFWQRWIDRFWELRQGAFSNANFDAVADAMADEIRESAARNFARWTAVPPRFGGWQGEIDHMKQWLTQPPRMDGGSVHPARDQQRPPRRRRRRNHHHSGLSQRIQPECENLLHARRQRTTGL